MYLGTIRAMIESGNIIRAEKTELIKQWHKEKDSVLNEIRVNKIFYRMGKLSTCM